MMLLYDVHRGESHYRHERGEKTSYKFLNEDTLRNDSFAT
jgi:hypothetical protein